MGKLEGKVVIITGGNSGVGEATAKLFAKEGAAVVISARRKEALDKVAKEIEELGGKVLAVPTDVSKVEDCEKLIEEAVSKFGKLDVLVNNAGVLDTGLKGINNFTIECGSHDSIDKTYQKQVVEGVLNVIADLGICDFTPTLTRKKRGRLNT